MNYDSSIESNSYVITENGEKQPHLLIKEVNNKYVLDMPLYPNQLQTAMGTLLLHAQPSHHGFMKLNQVIVCITANRQTKWCIMRKTRPPRQQWVQV